MPIDLLDRLQADNLHGLEQLIQSYEAAAPTCDRGNEAAAIADFFVDEGIGLRQTSLRHWDYHWSMALAGKIADRKEHGARLRSLLERTGRLLARHAAVARAYADASGQEVARLTQLEEQSKVFSQWVAECMARWELLDRPRKAADPAQFAAAQAAFSRGECEPVSEIVARLESGGPLVQE
jgi:hypothetical protein